MTGPIRVTLTVSDSYGILANSSPVIVSRDPRIVPPSHMVFETTVHNGGNSTVVVAVFDIYSRPVKGALVQLALVDSKNVTGIAPRVVKTINGQATLTISWLGASDPRYALVEVRSGQLQPERTFISKTQ